MSKKDTSKKDISIFDMSKKICPFNFRHVHFPSRTEPISNEVYLVLKNYITFLMFTFIQQGQTTITKANLILKIELN